MAEAKRGLYNRIFLYVLTPQIVPRIQSFFASGFTNLAYLIALIFYSLNLLPPSHSYLRRENKGRYGLHNVIIETARNLEFSFKKIDQVIIFFAIILGLFLFAGQFVIVLMMVITGQAFASGAIHNFFVLPSGNEQTDIAYRLLDMVFGVPDLFGNHTDGILPGFHDGLQSMFVLYSYAILLVGVIILAYVITTIVAETALTGTPFGKRFNHVWAPIRMVIGIGMLIPLASGLNSGQWIALYAAKFGSNFATNGWLVFNSTLSSTYLGDTNSLVGIPNPPEMMHLPAFFMLAHACDYGFESIDNINIDAYIVVTSSSSGTTARPLSETSYTGALEFSNFQDITIRFGQQETTNSGNIGFINPICGEISLSTSTLNPQSGGFAMQAAYYNLISDLWYGGPPMTCGGFAGAGTGGNYIEDIRQFGHNYMRYLAPVPDPINGPLFITDGGASPDGGLPGMLFKNLTYIDINSSVDDCILKAAAYDRAGFQWDVDEDLFRMGWAGAGIWYNKIAEVNGALATAVQAVPRPVLYPAIMEQIKQEKLQQDNNVPASTRFSPTIEDYRSVSLGREGMPEIVNTLYVIQQYWERNGYRGDVVSMAQIQQTDNGFINAINAILGTNGLFDMCKNTDVHPLAQLALTGKTLIESSVRNLGFSVASGVIGGAAYLADSPYGPYVGAFFDANSGLFAAVAGAGLLVGFILFYVLPLMPFLYFFFAVSGWVKGLFEAMVGIPLWALAHIRMDGEGLSGNSAKDGYFLVFEIFFRPIMIVIGLIASVIIFAAMVKVLNDIFFIVISNLAGFSAGTARFCGIADVSGLDRLSKIELFRGPVDEFFFTIVYAVIVYMIGMACFKLVDTIPNSIMRWMGANVKTFHEEGAADPGQLSQKVAVSGGQIGQSMQQAMQSLKTASKEGGKLAHDKAVQKDSLRNEYG